MRRRLIIAFFTILVALGTALFYFQYASRAGGVPASITVDTRRIIGPLTPSWRAIAQGGEEKGRMLEGIIPQLTELAPNYIRIDHIYDFYDVATRDSQGNLGFDFARLDDTVCDILKTGAKPFFSLSYMPAALSTDGSVIAPPKQWEDWAYLVEKTIERYSGRSTQMCGGAIGHALTNIYYEVWNEPELAQFGGWNIGGGEKDYKKLYYYAALGASRAEQVNDFALGGPGTASPLRAWMQNLAQYATSQNLRLDFLSWHRYTTDPAGYNADVSNVVSWVPESIYGRYSSLPKIITEWGYDSEKNPIADTDIGAAYTIASIRNFIDQNIFLAFSFEAKDGLSPSWGILTRDGAKKPRFYALKLLNLLVGNRIELTGEGTFVRGFAAGTAQKTVVILANYDQESRNTELVPVTFSNLTPGTYKIVAHNLTDETTVFDDLIVTESSLQKEFIMTPNAVLAIELFRK